jgi:peptide/nickel transport system permease protein
VKQTALLAATVFGALVACALIAGSYLGDNAVAIDTAHWQGYPLPPCFLDAAHCGGHVLGSDENGRDILARLLVGTRYTIGTAVLALLMGFAIATGLAGLARRAGRIVAAIVVRFAEGLSCLPRVPLVLLFSAVAYGTLGKSAAQNVLLLPMYFGVALWPRTFQLLRAPGTARVDIVRRALSDLATILLLAATTDFFGFGVQPPAPSWGNMLANAESNFEVAWWVCVFPGACIFVTVLLVDVIRRSLPATITARVEGAPTNI